MSKNVTIVGEAGNDCEIVSDKTLHGTIRFIGKGGRVFIDREVVGDFHIDVASGASVHIGAACHLSNLRVFALASGSCLSIGELCGFTGMAHFLMHEAANISVGNKCLFAGGVWMSVSDMHSIIDLDSNARINAAADIVIGDHVWLGDDARIHKGVTIGKDSIIAAHSLVTHDVPAHSIVGGIPARVIRNNVTWDINLL